MTEKDEPGDVDVIIKFDYDVVGDFTEEQREFVALLSEGLYNSRIDSWTFTSLPRDHPEFATGELDRSSYAELVNVENGEYWLKGVGVIRVGETDAGLLFYP